MNHQTKKSSQSQQYIIFLLVPSFCKERDCKDCEQWAEFDILDLVEMGKPLKEIRCSSMAKKKEQILWQIVIGLIFQIRY